MLRSQPRREPLAAEAVNARGVETYIPKLPEDQRTRPTGPLFPGYLFAHVEPESDDLLRIRSAPGVAYVLPRAGAPTLLPETLVSAIRAREHELASDQYVPTHGDRVKLRAGPFRLIEAVFDRRLNASGRVRILLELVHGSVAVQTQEANLELIRRRN
ncbi:MAG: hypothetical protein JOZ81_07315 [Chloroflexi bacterium]|nr:hypothetical protein [Chloroflexota bacterium]MBV9545432.1 hypothetical protein [Chloroflexota bacterium]